MKCRNAQISIEYIIITGFVVVAILIPSFIILFGSASKNISGSVNMQKISDLGNGLVNDAKQMYYLGLYSKKISTYEIPENVQNIFLVIITYNGTEYNYLGITVNEGKEPVTYTFFSNIPLTSNESNSNDIINMNLRPLIKECTQSGYDCKFYSFSEKSANPGRKNFRIETVLKENNIKSSIDSVLT